MRMECRGPAHAGRAGRAKAGDVLMSRTAAVFLLGLACVLEGCSPAVIRADERGIALENLPQAVRINLSLAGYYDRRALALADEHCRKFGRFARLKGQTADHIFYACIDRRADGRGADPITAN